MRRKSGRNGYTLLELCVTLAIISIMAAIVYPMFVPMRGEKTRQAQCSSYLKQIGGAAIMYAQDYDGRFPPTAYYKVVDDAKGRHVTERLWFNPKVRPAANAALSEEGMGYLNAYQNLSDPHRDFQCPPLFDGTKAAYLTNDLAGGAEWQRIKNGALTVIMMDGENEYSTTGHAYDARRPHSVIWNLDGSPAFTEIISRAVTRHAGGAEYLFSDGHVHWMKPKDVFFPPQDSGSRSHLESRTGTAIGPDPGGDMVFNGHKYLATFHLR